MALSGTSAYGCKRLNQTCRFAGRFSCEINDKASARGERARAAQRCDPTDEMRGSPDLPDALLESETEMGDGERGRDSGGPVSLYQIPPWHMVTGVRGRKAWGQSVKLSENTVLL